MEYSKLVRYEVTSKSSFFSALQIGIPNAEEDLFAIIEYLWLQICNYNFLWVSIIYVQQFIKLDSEFVFFNSREEIIFLMTYHFWKSLIN